MPEPDASGLGDPSFDANNDSFGSTGHVQVLGTNQLQAAIDKFEAAVSKLSALYDKAASTMPSGVSGSGSRSANNNAGGASFGNSAQGSQSGVGTFLRGMGNAWTGGKYPSASSGQGGGQGGSGFMGQFSVAGQPSGAPGGAGGQGGGDQGGGGTSGWSKIGTGFIAATAAISSFGTGRMADSTAMTNMTWQGNLINGGGWAGAQAQRRGAFGGGGVGLNNAALNAQDAATGYSTMQQWSGSSVPYSVGAGNQVTYGNGMGRALFGAASSFSASNPGLGWGGSVQAATSLYNPQMSMRMMQLGYKSTPLNMGGRSPSSMGSVVGGMVQRMFPGQTNKQGAVNPKNLAASLAPGQVGYENLASLGMSPDQISQMTQMMESYNTVSSKTGKNMGQVQSLFQQYYSGDKGAKGTLSKILGPNILQSLKTAQASQTGQTADVNTQFAQGVDKAAQSLAKFNNVLDRLLNDPILKQLVGYGGGASGAFGALTSGASLGAGAFGASKLLGMLGKGGGGAAGGLGKLLGMGGGDAAAGAGAGESVAGGGAAAGIGAGAGAGGALTVSLIESYILNKVGKDLGKKLGTDKGGAGSKIGSIIAGASTAVTGPTGFLIKGIFGGNMFAEGGRVEHGQPGVDDQPAMLQKGEVVLNPRAAQRAGYANLDRLNRENPNPSGKTSMRNGILHAAGGAAILADAKKYNGHRYVFGGPSNPQGGWDCSSFASWVLGHDEGMALPGGSWASTTNSGKSHGDVAASFIGMPGAHKVSNNAADIQAGDILVWPTHVGFGVGPGTMFSAYDTASGTLQTAKDMHNAGGPGGEKLTIMRIGAGGGVGATAGSAGSSTSSSATQSSTSQSMGGAGGSSPTSTSEADNVMSALGGSAAGISSSSPNTTATAASNGGGGGSGSTAVPGGSGAMGVDALAKYLLKAGYSKPAAAAAAGVAGGEGTGAMPEVTGSNGAGLIGWTPPSAMVKYGGTCAAAGIGHNSPAVDMANQEQAMVKWMRAFGWPPPQNKYPNSLAGAMQAAYAASAAYERPAVAGSDVHSNWITQAWNAVAKLGTGGTVLRDGPVIVGDRGPEVMNLPAGTHVSSAARSRVNGAQGVAQGPWQTAGSAQSGGANINLNFGDIVIQGAQDGTLNKQTVSNSVQEIFAGVKKMIENDKVIQAIANGSKCG